AGPGHRVQVPLRRAEQAIRARVGRLRAVRGRPALPVPVRARVSGAGHEAGPRRGRQGQGGHRVRPRDPHLLQVRRGEAELCPVWAGVRPHRGAACLRRPGGLTDGSLEAGLEAQEATGCDGMNELMRRMLFLPEQASTFALDVDHLHYFVITVTMFASAAVGLVAIGFFWKYRRRTENQATPMVDPTAGFEVAVITIPLAIFLLWFFIGFRDFVKLASPPPDAMDVYVMGKQWMWKFSYPEGPGSVGVLHVPANRPVRLLITSRDVVH